MRSHRRIAFAVLLSLVLVASVPAQCIIGLYVDAAGTDSWIYTPPVAFPVDVYVVMHVESTVAGAAYQIQVPPDFIFSAISYGPSGGGLNIPVQGYDYVGLGECALGFNGAPVLVAHYSMIRVNATASAYVIPIGPNLFENPLYPVYADCADNLIPCTESTALYLLGLAVENASIGAVKALYTN